jgi:hypothetical protein
MVDTTVFKMTLETEAQCQRGWGGDIVHIIVATLYQAVISVCISKMKRVLP